MAVSERIREGDLTVAMADARQAVVEDPGNAKHRVLLFQLFCVIGEWDRALTQLNVAGDLDDGTLGMVQTYREALKCEEARTAAIAGRVTPLILGEPEEWMGFLFEALKLSAQDRENEAQTLRARAFEGAPATAGTIDGTAFDWIADADPRFGPMIEAVINGRYYWVPFHRVSRIQFEEPEDLRDVVWQGAYFSWSNGGEAAALVPTRYPGSEAGDVGADILLARKTEWLERGPDFHIGLGQRMLATDADEFPLMAVRDVTLDSAEHGG
jgi:type VI secretion system protein ImpE